MSPQPIIPIFILLLTTATIPRLGSATTLVIKNEQKQNLAYVRCYNGLVIAEEDAIRPGKQITVALPYANKAPGKGELPALCVGAYNPSHGRHNVLYYFYDSSKDFERCKSDCVIQVTDTGFNRWNAEKRVWDMVPPRTWLS
ncbi:unnamed protein product [Linum trigynum]|uniref:S-protein homolog n=1 Tax=Linum trigynum TaxID=586398 RepID=A0AAV2G014_9ROSI